MSEKTTKKELEKASKNTALQAPAGFDFDRQEILGEMGDLGGYLSAYKKLVIAENVEGEFKIIDMLSEDRKNNIIGTFKEEEAIIFYAHSVYRLLRGTFNGNTDDLTKWADSDKEVLASSYNSPFVRNQNKSAGNFLKNPDYARFLEKENRGKLTQKAYCFIMLPKLFPGEIIPCSFGPSAWISISGLRKKLNSLGLPLPSVRCKLSLVTDENDEKIKYKRANFELIVKNNQPIMSVKSKEEYISKIKPILESIVEIHKNAVLALEDSDPVVDGVQMPETVGMPAEISDVEEEDLTW